MLGYREMFATPYVLVFVVTWLLLRLMDIPEGWRTSEGVVPRGPIYPVMRLVIILVALILVLI
jgi:hypothetical protein